MDDEIELSEWPDALDAYREAYELGRRAVSEADHCKHGGSDPERELATLKWRLKLRGLDPAEEARVRMAMKKGEKDGRAGDGMRW